jgi:O-antigen ligase
MNGVNKLPAIKIILPWIMLVLHLLYYRKNKIYYELLPYVYIAMYPYFSSNFSVFYYRHILQIIAIYGFIRLIVQIITRKRVMVINKYEAIYLLAILLSGIGAHFNSAFFLGVTNYVYILLVLIVIRSHLNEKNINQYLNIFVVNGIILALFSILEFFVLGRRAEVVFSNPNYLGFYLSLGAIINLFNNKGYKRSIKARFVNILFLMGIFFTGSSAVFMGVIFAYSLNLKFNFKKVLKLVPIGIVVVFIIIFFTREFLLNEISYSISESNAQRIGIWSLALDGFIENPIFGIGYNNFSNYFIENKYRYQQFSFLGAFFTYDYFVTHNDFLRVLTETGILGFSIFIIYFINIITLSSRIKEKHIKNMCLAIITLVLVFIFTHNNINSFDTWFMIGIPLYYTTNKALLRIK